VPLSASDTSKGPVLLEARIRLSRLETRWTILMKDRRKPNSVPEYGLYPVAFPPISRLGYT